MSMEPKDAVMHYQFGERAKSELIVTSQLLMTLVDYKDAELAGARRMLLSLMQSKLWKELMPNSTRIGTGTGQFSYTTNKTRLWAN